MLDGVLCEELYKNIGNNKAEIIQTRYLNRNDVKYLAGSDILHSIKNESSEISVSLHIYLPPNFKASFFNI